MALPVDCDLDTQCYIQQFMDHDPSSVASDMRCGPLTYDGLTGTDFAIRDPLTNPNGVNVIASAALWDPGHRLHTRTCNRISW